MSGSIATAGASAARSATAPGTRLSGDFDTFLTLLTTQLRNQSPTDPLDTNQLTNQLVQFASVEQQIAMNQNLGQLVSLQQANQVITAAPLIGQRAEVESDRITLQDGRGEVRLPAAGTARLAEITILDSAGRALRQDFVALGSSAGGWTWNGRDTAGRSLADGAYALRVTGRGTNGEEVPLAFTVAGRVTGAERRDGGMHLSLGGLDVGFGSLRRLLPGN